MLQDIYHRLSELWKILLNPNQYYSLLIISLRRNYYWHHYQVEIKILYLKIFLAVQSTKHQQISSQHYQGASSYPDSVFWHTTRCTTRHTTFTSTTSTFLLILQFKTIFLHVSSLATMIARDILLGLLLSSTQDHRRWPRTHVAILWHILVSYLPTKITTTRTNITFQPVQWLITPFC